MATLVSFQANRQYYADVLCINKNRPELACQGKCVLMQKLHNQFDFEQHKTASKLQHLLEQDIAWTFDKETTLTIKTPFSIPILYNSSNFAYREPLTQLLGKGIFRPPIV
ncbi:MAG: hypothetical protein HC817_11780 [Saprospiraceae bacterium]|nr:hypothetical protein [Saprospiraceae bacterium]